MSVSFRHPSIDYVDIPLNVNMIRNMSENFVIEGLEWQLEYYFGHDFDFVGEHCLVFRFVPIFSTTNEDVKRQIVWNLILKEDVNYHICVIKNNRTETHTRKTVSKFKYFTFHLNTTTFSETSNFILSIGMRIIERNEDDAFGVYIKG